MLEEFKKTWILGLCESIQKKFKFNKEIVVSDVSKINFDT